MSLRYRVVGDTKHFSVVKDGRIAWNGFAAADDREARKKVEKKMLDFVVAILWPPKVKASDTW